MRTMNEVIFNILRIVLSICSALVAAYLVPYIRNELKKDKYEKLLEIIEVAVKAAEQTIKGSGMGKIKKENVIDFVSIWMLENGINISQEQLSQLIEAAVFQLNN